MFCASCWRQCRCLLSFLFRRLGTGLESIAVISGLQNVAAVGEAIEQRGGHFGVPKDRGPFTEAQVRRDDDAGALVEFAQKMEEQGPARGAERQVSQLIQDHQVSFHQRLCDLASLSLGLFLLQSVDQFDR